MLESLEKAQSEMEHIHDLGSRDAQQRLESIFYLVLTARQGAEARRQWARIS